MSTCCCSDKTGTITLGNRQASEFIRSRNRRDRVGRGRAAAGSLADETPEAARSSYRQDLRIREHDMASFMPIRAVHRADPIAA